jgi:hypothetical protein
MEIPLLYLHLINPIIGSNFWALKMRKAKVARAAVVLLGVIAEKTPNTLRQQCVN